MLNKATGTKKSVSYIGVGSNIGDRYKNILSAEEIINTSNLCEIIEISKIYETEPVGYLDQDNFLNCVFKIATYFTPEELLDFLLNVEKKLKRKRIIHWGPRTIDLDILFYNNLVISTHELVIPHPRMHERMFVIKPFCNLAADYVHPVLKEKCFKIEERLKSSQSSLKEYIK